MTDLNHFPFENERKPYMNFNDYSSGYDLSGMSDCNHENYLCLYRINDKRTTCTDTRYLHYCNACSIFILGFDTTFVGGMISPITRTHLYMIHELDMSKIAPMVGKMDVAFDDNPSDPELREHLLFRLSLLYAYSQKLDLDDYLFMRNIVYTWDEAQIDEHFDRGCCRDHIEYAFEHVRQGLMDPYLETDFARWHGITLD